MRPAPVRRPSTWWWFLVPALTFGLGTFVAVFIAAKRLHSEAQLRAAAGYLAADILYFCVVAMITPELPARLAAYPFLAVAWLGGTLHTLYLQFLAAREPTAVEPVAPVDPAAAARAAIRAEARRIAETDPARAAALKIGRPDLTGREYDDGGLVDINHVPAGWIALALRLPRPMADEIVAARDRRLGFQDADELIIYCTGMTVERLATIRDLLLFPAL